MLVCRFGAMGDVVCCLPLCEEIRKKHPECLVVFVTNSGFQNLVQISKVVDSVYGSRLWCWPFKFPKNFQFFGLIQAVYCPLNPDEISSGVGFSGHLVESFARSCDITIQSLQPRLHLAPKMFEACLNKYFIKKHINQSRLLIALNGGPTWPVRMWEVDKWQELIKRIHAEYEVQFLLFGQSQNGRGSDLQALVGVDNLFNRTEPEEIAAILNACDLLIAIDSGPIHIAGALGTPVVGLFGAVNPQFRMPPDSLGKSIVGNVSCLYCNHRIPVGHWIENCPHEIACMKAITVDEVFQAVKEILEKNPKANFAKR